MAITEKKPTIWQVVSKSSSPFRADRRIVKSFDNIHDARLFAEAGKGDLKIRVAPERRRTKDVDPDA